MQEVSSGDICALVGIEGFEIGDTVCDYENPEALPPTLAAKSVRAEKGKVNIAVILLRHLSNFTDFNVLERDPRVHLFLSLIHI